MRQIATPSSEIQQQFSDVAGNDLRMPTEAYQEKAGAQAAGDLRAFLRAPQKRTNFYLSLVNSEHF